MSESCIMTVYLPRAAESHLKKTSTGNLYSIRVRATQEFGREPSLFGARARYSIDKKIVLFRQAWHVKDLQIFHFAATLYTTITSPIMTFNSFLSGVGKSLAAYTR